MNYKEIIKKLKSLANPKNVEGMVRFGISSNNTLGVSVPVLRDMAKKIKAKIRNLATFLFGAASLHHKFVKFC